ncbi:MAG TPA: hypothetical protein PKA27_14740, partial [Fimbriimonadaceae bacterium]|nr:hypothetical protein [Fimbriimonadaceae bacterium]
MDYIPTSQAELHLWGQNFDAVFTNIALSVGFSPVEVAEMNDHFMLFSEALAAHTAAAAAARAATEEKNGRQAAWESLVRSAVRRVQSHPNATDAMRAALGITVPKSARNRLPIPTALPQVILDWSVRGQITIHAGMTPNNERDNRFPAGCYSVLIEHRTANSEWQFVAITTTSPYLHRLSNPVNEEVSYR